MTAPADLFGEVDSIESYDGMEFADEAARQPFAPGRRVFVPGGIASATLRTPKGDAKLNLPAPVPTLAQFRALEQALNGVTQRLNATNTQLLQVRRELAASKANQLGSGPAGLLFPLIMQKQLREELEAHTHTANNTAPTIPASSGGGFDALLPILLLSPNVFGGGTGATPGAAQSDSMSQLLPLLLITQFIK